MEVMRTLRIHSDIVLDVTFFLSFLFFFCVTVKNEIYIYF